MKKPVLSAFVFMLCFAAFAAKQPNIVFISIDDLRVELNCYGASHIKSPNIDKLAQRGMLFNKAYCQQALCSPSRTSIMTGTYPETNGVLAWNSRDEAHTTEVIDQLLTFPQYLRENGYNTLTIGKVYHGESDPEDWTEESKRGAAKYQDPKTRADILAREKKFAPKKKSMTPWAYNKATSGPATECYDGDPLSSNDAQKALGAIDLLRKYANDDKPFMLALGLTSPHLPFVAPKQFWDLYDRDQIDVPSREDPVGGWEHALVPSGYEIRSYCDTPGGDQPFNDAKTKELRHGYYAATSYVDFLVGLVMDELETLGVADNTLIMLWGDHGWKIGEYGDWSKYTAIEHDARVPLIVAGPGVKAGAKTDALVDLVDMYPTLCEVAGLDVPEHVEGTSFVPLFGNPERAWKKAAYSFYDREADKKVIGMGRSIRTAKYRYTEWRDQVTNELIARELYDHSETMLATVNLANNPEYRSVVKQHAALLAKGTEGFQPEGIE